MRYQFLLNEKSSSCTVVFEFPLSCNRAYLLCVNGLLALTCLPAARLQRDFVCTRYNFSVCFYP